MGDYTEHLISMAGGDGGTHALDLDAIQARADAATKGPWSVTPGSYNVYEFDGYMVCADLADGRTANFIAAARADVPALLALVREQAAQIKQVRELHTFAHTDVEPWAMGYRYSGDHCGFDGEHWPCDTVAALTATEAAESTARIEAEELAHAEWCNYPHASGPCRTVRRLSDSPQA